MASFVGSGQQARAVEELVARLSSSSSGFAVAPAVSFRSSADSGVGIYAKESVKKGAVLVQIPFDQCLSAEAVTASPGLRVVFEEQEQLAAFPDEVLAIGLMYGMLRMREQQAAAADAARSRELETACPWLAHVKTLPPPESFNTTLFWSDDELAQLKGCSVFHLTQLMKRQIDADWESVHAQLAQVYPELLGGATKDLYAWALSIVYSRALGFTRRGAPVRVIAPVLDMANHDPHAARDSADTFSFADDEDAVRLLAAQDLSAGDECSAVYGRYPNSKLAYTYGFVVHGNPVQAVDLWARVPASSFAAERKRQLLQGNALTAQQNYDFSGTLRGGGWVSPALLATIRVIQIADEAELAAAEAAAEAAEEEGDEAVQSSTKRLGPFLQSISVRNEAAMLGSLTALLTARLAVEAAEADRLRLGELLLDGPGAEQGVGVGDGGGGGGGVSREFQALVIRVEEREVVRECLAAVRGWAAELERLGEAYEAPDARLLAAVGGTL